MALAQEALTVGGVAAPASLMMGGIRPLRTHPPVISDHHPPVQILEKIKRWIP